MLSVAQSKTLPIEITKGYNPVRFPVIDNQTTYNMYEFNGAMIPTPGHAKLYSIADEGKARGGFYSDIFNQMVIVIDGDVFLATDTTFNLVGSLRTLSGKVFFSENALLTDANEDTGDPGGQVGISDGENIYILKSNGDFVQAVTDQSNPLPFKPGMLAFQDDFFFTIDLNSNRIYASNINDGTIWPVLSFSTIDSIARGLIAFERMLFVFGKDLTQLFQDAAAFPFPYQKDITRSYEYGCLSAGSIAVSSGVFVWLASTRATTPLILASTGGKISPISTPGIDNVINNLEKPEDSNGFIYEVDGHIFYQINFVSDNLSLLYDFVTKKWFVVSSANQRNVHPIQQAILYENTNVLLAITHNDGIIYEFSGNIFTDNGKIVKRTIIAQNITSKERPLYCREVDVQIEQGENQTTSKICLSFSKDRGRTYGGRQLYELGNIGFRQRVARFRQLGSARWWTFKFDFLSQERFVVLKAEGFFA